MPAFRKYLSILLSFCILLQLIPSVSFSEGLVVYQEYRIEEQHTEEEIIPESIISQQYILEHMTYEDELYELKINEEIYVQAYTIELTVDVNTQTSLASVIPSQLDDYDINWPSVIAKFAVGTAIIVVVGVVHYITKGTSSYFIMATPGKVLRDAIVGGAIEATLQVLSNEIGQGGITSKAAVKYAIEGFADGYMWGAIGSVLHVTSQNLKRLKAFKLATGGTLKIKLDGTVIDTLGNVVGKAYYGKKQWYLLDAASNATRIFDKTGKEILDIAKAELPAANLLPANTTLSVGAQSALKVCYTDASGIVYRIGDDLVPNIVYTIGDKVYKTDTLGRIVEVSFKSLSLKDAGRGRMLIADTMKAIGHGDALPADQRGHLIADMFDGNNTLANIVPMSSEANQGTVKAIETTWANTIRNGGNVSGSISITYDGNCFRPNSFTYSYDIGDGLVESLISNH